jgi:hypothetical protein
MPLVADPETFDEDLMALWMDLDILHVRGPSPFSEQTFRAPRNPFLTTVYAMAAAYYCNKMHNPEGRRYFMERVEAPDWHRAASEWFERRDRARTEKERSHGSI